MLNQQVSAEEAFQLSLLDHETEARLATKPQSLLEDWAGQSPKVRRSKWIIIDEIQRQPKLLDVVHRGIEELGLKFGLTGSSARKLRRGSANLLAGRAVELHLHPFTAQELGDRFRLQDAINWGTLPKIFALDRDEAEMRRFLSAFVNTYLREEIQAEQIVRNMDPFRLFLEVAAAANGTILNAAKLGRQCGVDPKTAQRYFEILSDTLVGFFLPAFSASVRSRQLQHPKFYFFDTGAARAAANTIHGKVVPGTYEFGKLFEQFVILEALRLNDYLEAGFQLSYLKTQTDLEVDLILTRGRTETIAIEIKSGAEPDRSDIAKLNALTSGIKGCRRFILCTGKRSSVVEGVRVLEWQTGLQEIFELPGTLQSQHGR